MFGFDDASAAGSAISRAGSKLPSNKMVTGMFILFRRLTAWFPRGWWHPQRLGGQLLPCGGHHITATLPYALVPKASTIVLTCHSSCQVSLCGLRGLLRFSSLFRTRSLWCSTVPQQAKVCPKSGVDTPSGTSPYTASLSPTSLASRPLHGARPSSGATTNHGTPRPPISRIGMEPTDPTRQCDPKSPQCKPRRIIECLRIAWAETTNRTSLFRL